MLTIHHVNDAPKHVHDIYFTRTDLDLAQLIHRHVCLTSAQLYAFIKLSSVCISAKRISKLIKYGFLGRYCITDPDGKRLAFYTVSELTKLRPPSLDAWSALALLSTNEFLLTQCRQGKKIRYTIVRDLPVTAHIHANDRLYVCVRPNGDFRPESVAGFDRVIALLPDESAVPLLDETAGAPVRYVFDHTPGQFWRYENGKLSQAQIFLA